jgi:hypothetical protein
MKIQYRDFRNLSEARQCDDIDWHSVVSVETLTYNDVPATYFRVWFLWEE